MRQRTIRILLLLAVAAAAFTALAAPGFARHGSDDDGEHLRGTVASFADGVLTIRQSDGDEVRAKVTRRTEIECTRRDRSRSDHRGRGRDDDHHNRRGCGTRLLTAGRRVREAELRTTSSGLVFREIEVVR